MKTGTALATTLFALARLTLLAQQQPPANQPPDSPSMQQNPSSTQPPTTNNQTSSPEAAAAAEMTPVDGELVSKLDSKTAKTGDSIVVQTRTSVKTPEGTEIPKGSKLVGHVIGVQPSEAGQTSQVALLLDHVELKGGQSLPVHSQIQSIGSTGSAASTSGSRPMSVPPAGGSSNPRTNGTGAGSASSPSPSSTSQGAASTPQAAPAENDAPAPGMVVATTGKIDIRTTSVPGVLLANNAPGQQDPRMVRTSSILLGAKQDIQLESGTQMVIGVSATSGGPQ